MKTVEAREIVTEELAKYRAWNYDALCEVAETPKRTFQVTSASGTRYFVDIMVFWDGQPGGAVRVFGAIDDGGWRAYVPLTESFIKAPDGSFVDEEPGGRG